MRKVAVIQIGESIPVIDSGMGYFRYGKIAKYLAEANYDVQLITNTYRHSTKTFRFLKNTRVKLENNLQCVCLHALPKYNKNISLQRLLHYKTFSYKLKKYLENENFDLLILGLPSIENAVVCRNYCLRNKIPYILDIIDIWPDVYLSIFPKNIRSYLSFLIFKDKIKIRKVIEDATFSTYISKSYLEWGRKTAPKQKYHYLSYLGSNICRTNLNGTLSNKVLNFISNYKYICLYVGSTGNSYDISTLIKSSVLINSQKNDIGIIIVGKLTQKQISLLKVFHNNIISTGWLNTEEIYNLYTKAHIGLCCYSANAVQSLPYKPFDYLSYGLYLVHSLSGDLNQICTRYNLGINYKSGSPKSLAKSIINACKLTSTDTRNRIISLYNKKFNNKVIYDIYVDRIKKVINK